MKKTNPQILPIVTAALSLKILAPCHQPQEVLESKIALPLGVQVREQLVEKLLIIGDVDVQVMEQHPHFHGLDLVAPFVVDHVEDRFEDPEVPGRKVVLSA